MKVPDDQMSAVDIPFFRISGGLLGYMMRSPMWWERELGTSIEPTYLICKSRCAP